MRALARLFAVLPLLAAPSARAQEAIDFSEFSAGAVVSEAFGTLGSGPVVVYGFNPKLPGQNAAVVFDSANPTGDDPDLSTPSNGNLLIVAEALTDANGDGFVDDPDDEDAGGLLIFDFVRNLGPVTISAMTLVDNEVTEGAAVIWLDATGASLGEAILPSTPDGGLANVAFGAISNVAYMLVGFAGSAAIDDIEFQTETECAPCDGKVTELTLQYLGSSSNANVKVTQKGGEVVFEGIVQPGDRFSFEGVDKKDTLGTEIRIRVNGVENAEIHTSCSQPIGPGLVAGDFRVVGGSSRNGGLLCPLSDRPEGGFCADKAKPQTLGMVYTGTGCEASSSGQDPKKLTCDGDPGGASPVWVVASDKADPTDSKAKIWFLGSVPLGGAFEIDATNADEDDLKSETFVHVYDATGAPLQFVRFHTSCSQPLAANDRFGSVLLQEFGAAPNE